ncbi:TetR/AcrR family transcriptional regulator [Mycolicibacterium vaccae]|uniref:TetR/AcrR family transcriptional regulator n=1 Tax=Mycolicibacterium vaccae TaxID=1810 RepID=UPI003CE87F2F
MEVAVADDWVMGGDRRAAAVERIHAAATDIATTQGFDALDIDLLAERLHCSRATVYRYAGGKAAIRDAVLMRLAARIVETVRASVDGLRGADRVIAAINVALEQIRSDPMRKLGLTVTSPASMTELHSSPMLAQLAADLTGITDDDPEAAQWIVRVVVSLAFWPPASSETEQQLIRRFVAPAFDQPSST